MDEEKRKSLEATRDPTMSDRDWENLLFLYCAEEDKIREWYDNVPTTDHLYAQELFSRHSSFMIERFLYEMPQEGWAESNKVLSNFRTKLV